MTVRRKDRAVSRFSGATLMPTGWEVAQRAVKRLQAKYPSELDLRPVYFNGRDTRVKTGTWGNYGAARQKFERFMDRQTYWDWSWMETGPWVKTEDDTKDRAPFSTPRYPASLFQGRKKVQNDRRQCERDGCGLWFTPKRKEQRFHDAACKQMAYRRRQGVQGHGVARYG